MTIRQALLLTAPFLLLPSAALSAGRDSASPQDEVCAAVMDGMDGSIIWREAPGPVAARPSVPHLIGSPAVVYPAIARQSRVSGPVCLQVKIDEQGRVRQARALCGPSLLRLFAQHTIRQWRYTPAMAEGRPVETTGYVVLNFQLEE